MSNKKQRFQRERMEDFIQRVPKKRDFKPEFRAIRPEFFDGDPSVVTADDKRDIRILLKLTGDPEDAVDQIYENRYKQVEQNINDGADAVRYGVSGFVGTEEQEAAYAAEQSEIAQKHVDFLRTYMATLSDYAERVYEDVNDLAVASTGSIEVEIPSYVVDELKEKLKDGLDVDSAAADVYDDYFAEEDENAADEFYKTLETVDGNLDEAKNNEALSKGFRLADVYDRLVDLADEMAEKLENGEDLDEEEPVVEEPVAEPIAEEPVVEEPVAEPAKEEPAEAEAITEEVETEPANEANEPAGESEVDALAENDSVLTASLDAILRDTLGVDETDDEETFEKIVEPDSFEEEPAEAEDETPAEDETDAEAEDETETEDETSEVEPEAEPETEETDEPEAEEVDEDAVEGESEYARITRLYTSGKMEFGEYVERLKVLKPEEEPEDYPELHEDEAEEEAPAEDGKPLYETIIEKENVHPEDEYLREEEKDEDAVEFVDGHDKFGFTPRQREFIADSGYKTDEQVEKYIEKYGGFKRVVGSINWMLKKEDEILREKSEEPEA